MIEPRQGEKYVHFKGKDKIYEIITIARNCENPEEKFVIYKNLYSLEEFPIGTIWSRSLEDFCGVTYLEGKKVKRFIKIE